jgi:hypothetical protein
MEVTGYCNYLIYQDGKVYSKNRKRYLKPGTDTCGYLQVNLCKDGKPKTHQIHRLVAEHYIPNPENKPQVDHINRIRNDNRVENLSWATPSENGQNTGIRKDNKSGHKNICHCKTYNRWKYQKEYRCIVIKKYFKTKTEALCFKFVYLLKIKCNLI